MKTALTSLIFFIFGITMISRAQIPNPGFEFWTGGDPDGWVTSNLFPAGLVNILKTTDVHSGSFALQGDVVDFYGTPMAPVIQSGPGGVGFPINEKFQALVLYYKFTSANADKFSVNVAFTKNGEAVAQGAVADVADVENYSQLVIPMGYAINVTPDTAIIQISITGPTIGSDVHLGSVMYVDDLEFILNVGIGDPSGSDMAVKCYPNPASNNVTIDLDENVPGTPILKVFDIYGKQVKEIGRADQNGKSQFQFSVAELSSGIYFYSINGENCRYQGKFMVKR